MKQWSSLRIAVVFAGCFLGAGYVSGQEIWQFFASYGLGGIPGIFLAVLLMTVLGIIIMLCAKRCKIVEMDRLMIPWKIPALRTFCVAETSVLLFVNIALMVAGCGALLHQLFDIPTALGTLAMCILSVLVASLGLRGIANVYSALTPLIVLITLCVVFAALSRYGFGTVVPSEVKNPMMPFWWIGSLLFMSYNVFGAVPVFAPVGIEVQEEKKVRRGVICGGIALLVIALGSFTAMFTYLPCTKEELPMVALATKLHPMLGYVYGLLLLLAMFGVSISSIVALQIYGEERIPKLRKHKTAVLISIAVLAFCGSFVGFSGILGKVFPIFGYGGLFFLCGLVVRFVHSKKTVS